MTIDLVKVNIASQALRFSEIETFEFSPSANFVPIESLEYKQIKILEKNCIFYKEYHTEISGDQCSYFYVLSHRFCTAQKHCYFFQLFELNNPTYQIKLLISLERSFTNSLLIKLDFSSIDLDLLFKKSPLCLESTSALKFISSTLEFLK